jgi:hypothetical protein
MTFPTASDSLIGTGKWSAGPSLVVLTMPGHWVLGALASNQWSFAGSGKNDVNSLLVQPFVNYNFSHGWYLTTSPVITANWLTFQQRPLDLADRGRYWQAFQARQAAG